MVYIIGIGPGTKDFLLPIAKKRIEESDCLIGAKRNLLLFQDLNKETMAIEGHFNKIIPYLKKHKEKKQIAILISGDPGLYSLLEKVSGSLKKEEYVVIPGISTLQLAFAKLGQSWYDTKIISLHGRKIDNLTCQIKPYNKVFLFTDANFPPHKIARHLLKEGLENRRAVVLENLSYPWEKITDTDLKGLSRMRGFGLCGMLIERR